ncbi:MAG: response regulator [Candidatus Omnitrophica bacterium]|nr:response regulator [Candidatus Omnitrophota bacterium]
MMKILVVDDERDVCDFVSNFFGLRGFQVFCALNGEDALQISKTQDPLIVLQDIRMPGIDGVETLRRMKEARPNNRVIMVTCVEDIERVEDAKKYGADGYITKPLVLNDLVKAVNDAVTKLKPNVTKE